MALERHKRDWEDLAKLDAFRAVLVEPQSEEEFFRSGADEVAAVLAEAERLGRPAQRERALDFGCGLGRLTRALAGSFAECVGVDISATMVERARELNAAVPGCTFVVNTEPHLRAVRCCDLRPGLLEHRAPAHAEPGRRRLVHRRARAHHTARRPDGLPAAAPGSPGGTVSSRAAGCTALLRAVGVDRGRLHGGGLTPMRMLGIAEDDVRRIVERAGGRVLATTGSTAAGRYASLVYYVARA